MTDQDLHASLIGAPGSRRELNTPVLVIDRPALERNIARMAAFAASKGVKLRPHAKTHKSVDIAKVVDYTAYRLSHGQHTRGVDAIRQIIDHRRAHQVVADQAFSLDVDDAGLSGREPGHRGESIRDTVIEVTHCVLIHQLKSVRW